MAVVVKSKTGKNVTLLNPQEKRNKYFDELRLGRRKTNDGHFKLENGKGVKLTDEAKAYRSGYIQAQNDSAKVYNSKKHKRKNYRSFYSWQTWTLGSRRKR